MIVLEALTIDITDPLKLFRLSLEFLDTRECFERAKWNRWQDLDDFAFALGRGQTASGLGSSEFLSRISSF